MWSWAIAGATVPLLLLLAGLFIPKAPEWAGVVAVVFWPTEIVGAFLGLMATDSGADSSVVSAIIIAISILLNAAVYSGIGLILWTLGFSRFFQQHAPS